MRYIVTNGSTIVKSGYTQPGTTQAGVGQTEYAVEGSDGASLSDNDFEVVDGELVAAPGYPGEVPTVTLVVVEP